MTENTRAIAIPTNPVDNEMRADPNPDLVNALSIWQNSAPFVERVMDAVAPVMHDLKVVPWDAVVAFATLMKHLDECDASMLYHGKVIWNAASQDADLSRYNKPFMTAAKTRPAAVAYGERMYPRSGFTVHKITIATTKARGIDVNAFSRNPNFAHEEEILVKMIDFKLEANDDDDNEDQSWKLRTVMTAR